MENFHKNAKTPVKLLTYPLTCVYVLFLYFRFEKLLQSETYSF